METTLFEGGYLMQLFASGLLGHKVQKSKSTYGLSIDTQILFTAATLSRLAWALDTRLADMPLTYIEMFLSALAGAWLPYSFWNLRHSNLEHVPYYLKFYFTLPMALGAAFLFNPADQWLTKQVLVSFTIYAETLALIPQLVQMSQMTDIESLTTTYVWLVVGSRVVRSLFWLVLWAKGEIFLCLILADAIHTGVALRYLFIWRRRFQSKLFGIAFGKNRIY
eukprot:GHVP01020654.1.p1 GENE.GHVP01020654.1~~GHVP01020654.1.p1  ORF type:complete len:222 (-),score=19.71 GHVP01020654.1:385-1050(-)